MTTGRPRSGYFGLGNSFLLSASFLSSVDQDEVSSEPDNPVDPENVTNRSYNYLKEESKKVEGEVNDVDKAG